jgi:hypothetical protein
MEGGRPLYREAETGLFLYFHDVRGAWAIGDTIGSSAPYAFVDDRAGTPGMMFLYEPSLTLETQFFALGPSFLSKGPSSEEHLLRMSVTLEKESLSPTPMWCASP